MDFLLHFTALCSESLDQVALVSAAATTVGSTRSTCLSLAEDDSCPSIHPGTRCMLNGHLSHASW